MAVGMFVKVEVRPEKVAEVESQLQASREPMEAEEGLLSWFAAKVGPTTFLIFNTFVDDEARQRHLASEMTAEMSRQADDLFAEPPMILEHEVLAETVGR